MQASSTKPYMLRAIYQWCLDNAFTPYLAIVVDSNTQVPANYVKNGEIVLNINDSAVKNLLIENDAITFTARFNGVSNNIYVPIATIKSIFARENGHGLFFEPEPNAPEPDNNLQMEDAGAPDTPPPPHPKKKPPNLKIVK